MTKTRAIAMLAAAAEDQDLTDDAADLFAAIYGRPADNDDGDAGELISLCYAAPEVARAAARRS